jgi:hypothetical protein
VENEKSPAGNHAIQLIPIYIGVAGHKDIPEDTVPELKAKVAAIITELRNNYPNTPLKVLSSLAEGADSLVAQVGSEKGCGLIAVLPMPIKEYETDFLSEVSRNTFHSLLEKAEAAFEMPLATENTPDTIRHAGEPRDRQYAAAGNYVAAHSQVLIALWNGIYVPGIAGTSAVVRIKLSGNFDQSAHKPDPFYVPDSGPVYHIFTRRKAKDTGVITKPPKPEEIDWFAGQNKQDSQGIDILYPAFWKKQGDDTARQEEAQAYYAEILSKIDRFNEDAKAGPCIDRVHRCKQDVLPTADWDTLPKGGMDIFNLFGGADILAQQFKKKSLHALQILLAGAVVAFSFLGIFSELLPTAYILALFPATLGVLYGFYRSVEKKGIKDKFSNYRALAEALRVQLFWKLIGSKENVPNHYLRKFKREMGWILHAVRNISITATHALAAVPPIDKTAAFNLAMRYWVDGQRKYYEGALKEAREKVDKQQRFTLGLFFFALALVGVLFVLKGISVLVLGHSDDILGMADVKEWLIGALIVVAVDIVLATGAARAAFVEKLGLLDEIKQYQRMQSLYGRASRIITDSIDKNNLEAAESLLIDLGREALTENGDWLLLQRSRPLEMPLEG